MEVSEILTLFENPGFSVGSFSWEERITPFEIKPYQFLSFAEDDLKLSYPHKALNALSNAKRALDCQLDSLICSFGLFKSAQKENWKFPKKIEIINKLGILAPRILEKINRIRNLMEHEYVRPDSEQVEDFIDIVSLFFAATDKFIYKFLVYYDFDISTGPGTQEYKLHYSGVIQILENEIKCEITSYTENNLKNNNEVIIIKSDDPNYLSLLNKYLEKAMKY